MVFIPRIPPLQRAGAFMPNISLTLVAFVNRSSEIHKNKYDYSLVDYKNSKDKVKIICPIHGIFEQVAGEHIRGKGCKKCAMDYFKIDTKIFIERSNLKHKNKYDYSLVDYKNSKDKVKIICPKHGIFKQSPAKHINGTGCPYCRLSRGEMLIKNFLIENNVTFYPQKKFGECRNKLPLPFDFYLPDYNICVEYQGEQHIKPVKFFGGIDNFKKTQSRDLIKKEYCNKNKIRYLAIPYFDNPIDILKKELNL